MGSQESERPERAGARRTDTEQTAVLPSGRAHEVRTQTGRRPPDSRAFDLSNTRTIDRFELIRELARGGMGQVFLARDTKLGRKVAIKFLLRNDPDFVQRFLVEARATARCTHENIVTIYEVGEYGGLPYMVLEYLEGKTLSEVLETRPTPRQFAELMVPVLRAHQRAHEHGIVHRHHNPSNIVVTDHRQMKVHDFGVARIIDHAAAVSEQLAAGVETRALHARAQDGAGTYTGSNSLVGTLPYMSPEQWGADLVDHQSDLWAVGIMFWRALTNAHPAGSMAPDKLRERLTDLDTPLPSIASQEPGIPAELAAIVDRTLAKRKAARYQRASELLADLQTYLAPKTDRALGDVCPYRGLAAFAEDDAKYFFGRSNEIRTALAQLEGWPLLAVIGPSGVGKSSFVHAGLVPAIRGAGGAWQVRVLRPGRVPLHRLASVLEEALATGEHAQDLMAQLLEAPGLFGAMLRTSAQRRNQKVLVVVDQLEELFTLCDSDKIRQLFLAALLAAADDPSSPVRVVLSMRADFLDRLAGHKAFLAELSRGLFFLTAPDEDNLREALVRPAELAGYMFEDVSIVEDMMQTATSRGALPLLSFAATRLWEARDRTRHLLTVAAYEQMGGVGGAFARHADQVAAAIAPHDQTLLRAILTRLVTPEGTRAVVDRDELRSLSDDEAEVERVLDQLVHARLIHLHTDPDQVATVEIVHEMLITEWPTLRRWLEDTHAMRGFVEELRQAARQWASHGQSNDLVWRGATAEEALGLAKRHVLDLAAVEREFLEAVRRQAARARRRTVAVFATISLAIAGVMGAGAVGLVRIRAAEHASERAEASARKDAAAKAHALADEAKALQEAKSARDETQQQYDIIKQKEDARAAAEALAAQANHAEKLTRGELEQANEELRNKVAEALAAEAAARHATADAKAANARTQGLLAQERAAREKLEAEKKAAHIYDGDLTAPAGGK